MKNLYLLIFNLTLIELAIPRSLANTNIFSLLFENGSKLPLTENEKRTECDFAVSMMIISPLANERWKNLFSYSGKAINDFGDYKACTNSEFSRYYMIKILNYSVPLTIGLCGPTECYHEEYNYSNPDLAALLNMI